MKGTIFRVGENVKMEKIIVEIRNVYGNERIYPVNYIDQLQKLTGSITLSKTHIKALKELGFSFEVKKQELTEV